MKRAPPMYGIQSFAIWATVTFGVLMAFSIPALRALPPMSPAALAYDAVLAAWLFGGHYLALRVRDREMRKCANVQPD